MYTHKLVHFGPGGISCPCCTPHGKPAKNKRYANRKVRQSLKQEQEVEEGEWFNYWSQLDPSDVMEEEGWQEYWERENVEYYYNYMGRRDKVDNSRVYSLNTYVGLRG